MHDSGPLNAVAQTETASNSANVSQAQSHVDKPRKMLYLFSGPVRVEDGFSTFCKANGFDCDYMDKEIDDSHDLIDQQIWEGVLAELPNYDAYLTSPPCSTFTAARREGDGGPRPLRTPTGPGRYGVRDLTIAEKKQRVKEGTLLARRAHETATTATDLERPWILEQPHWRQGKTSMLTLDEFQCLLNRKEVNRYTLAQCRYGADVEKLTDPDLSDMELTCNHPPIWWRIPWSGEWIHSPHPPLKGRQKAVRAEDWTPDMLRDRDPDGPFITRSYAAYPAQLNKALADKLCSAATDRKAKQTQHRHATDVAEAVQLDTQVEMPWQLRQKSSQREPDQEMWSLRNVYNSLTGKARHIGVQVGNLIERHLDSSPEIEETIVGSFGKPLDEVQLPTKWIDDLRHRLASLLQRHRQQDMPESCDDAPVVGDTYNAVIRGRLLEYWARVMDDPAASAAKWLYEGAPAGLEVPFTRP